MGGLAGEPEDGGGEGGEGKDDGSDEADGGEEVVEIELAQLRGSC
jgi:hypothetical protein